MRLKLHHVLHPVRTSGRVRSVVATNWKTLLFARRVRRHFAGDPRYDLRAATDGLADHGDPRAPDVALLERICRAYARALHGPTPEPYRATPWWEETRRSSLGPVMEALRSADVEALARMYGNFFRDPCSGGLIGRAHGLPTSRPVVIRRYALQAYLGGALLRYDHWCEFAAGRFQLADLAGPGVGNPFGIMLSGTLIEVGAEFRHHCAQWILSLLDRPGGVVAEIGGGFGGMAYYLLRDRPGITYMDFDLPESLSLAAWYLTVTRPGTRLVLAGEEGPEGDSTAQVSCMPLACLERVPTRSVDIAFSAHALTDVAPAAAEVYVREIVRTTRKAFLYIGGRRMADLLTELGASRGLRLERTSSAWAQHIGPKTTGVECQFSIAS